MVRAAKLTAGCLTAVRHITVHLPFGRRKVERQTAAHLTVGLRRVVMQTAEEVKLCLKGCAEWRTPPEAEWRPPGHYLAPGC